MTNVFLTKTEKEVPRKKWWPKFNKNNLVYLLVIIPSFLLVAYLIKERKRTGQFLSFYHSKIILPNFQQF